MSRENVEVVLAGYAAAERQDPSAFELVDEEVLWDMTGLGMPDLARVYRGRDEVIQFWTSWLAAWEALEFDTDVLEAVGDHVVVEVRQRNRGVTSGVAVDFHYFQAFTVRGGRITASYATETRAEARQAVGLPE